MRSQGDNRTQPQAVTGVSLPESRAARSLPYQYRRMTTIQTSIGGARPGINMEDKRKKKPHQSHNSAPRKSHRGQPRQPTALLPPPTSQQRTCHNAWLRIRARGTLRIQTTKIACAIPHRHPNRHTSNDDQGEGHRIYKYRTRSTTPLADRASSKTPVVAPSGKCAKMLLRWGDPKQLCSTNNHTSTIRLNSR